MSDHELEQSWVKDISEVLIKKNFTEQTSPTKARFFQTEAIIARATESILNVPAVKQRSEGVDPTEGFVFSFSYGGIVFDTEYSRLSTTRCIEEMLIIQITDQGYTEASRLLTRSYHDGRLASEMSYKFEDDISSDRDESKEQALRMIELIEDLSYT